MFCHRAAPIKFEKNGVGGCVTGRPRLSAAVNTSLKGTT
ncbi:hypothetical protein CHCC20440_4162 [Bacillus licheniformis]|nr:hypothetical protein B4091_4294 [Bacillus licheniformis]TWJ42050.1 hypothetical protein CHCC5026_3414 [Bacillus licheniformis]TWK16714.1 hypothetical protein CHCC20440_4162 [Bacillus licheniformis]TWL01646.1 hypothetical protein CHCC20325_0744 [Bacillus licheniformis]TWN22535.1 hypothetical protein CHCC14562_4571 [Bacillus licheniformis]